MLTSMVYEVLIHYLVYGKFKTKVNSINHWIFVCRQVKYLVFLHQMFEIYRYRTYKIMEVFEHNLFDTS